MVSRVPAMSKGARYETPTVSGVNDARKDVGRHGQSWSARCGPCRRGSGAEIYGSGDVHDAERRGVEDADGVAGVDDVDGVAIVNYFGRYAGRNCRS